MNNHNRQIHSRSIQAPVSYPTRRRLAGVVTAVSLALAAAGAAHAAEARHQQARKGQANSSQAPGLSLATVVVTATPTAVSKMQSSISVSTLNTAALRVLQPMSPADALRDIPGIRSEASGGQGNANIAVRGLPVASGGGKYVQLQENGLPVLQFGDIAFATPDTFMRIDYNLARIEVVRGGSASTFASDAPGAVINFIDKTGGAVAHGDIGVSTGLSYRDTRYDFDYGGPLAKHWRFHVGGFYSTGKGVRTVGYTADNGYQFKANVTRELSNGFLRFYGHLLDTRAPVYLPVPMRVSGNGVQTNPAFGSIAGFSALTGAPQSPYWQRDLAVNASGNRIVTDISDGYHSKVSSFGGELSLRLPGRWHLDDKFRIAKISGDFVGPYPQEVASASTLASEIGGAGATLLYATGPNAGHVVANPATLNGNGLAVRYALFNVTLPNMGNAINDLKFSKSFAGSGDQVTTVTAGLFQSRQNIVQDWHWNTYLSDAAGKNAVLLNVENSSGVLQTQNGLVAYGVPYWGNCCTRSYDGHYDTTAPYASVQWQNDQWNLDGSLRYDTMRARGSYAGSTQATYDVNGDGIIQVPEQSVSVVNSANPMPINYSVGYLSWSFGANYELTRDLALFARASEGGRANADRLLFGGGIEPNGDAVSQVAVNKVRQYEGGVKAHVRAVSVFATAFYAKTQETNQDVTQNKRLISRVYHAYGLELEGAWHYRFLRIRGGVTYTHSRIVSDAITPSDVGYAPQRQAKLVYQFTPSLVFDRVTVAMPIIGTTDAWSGQMTLNGRRMMQPGYTQVDLYARYDVTRAFSVAFDVNNLTNTIGITEVDSGPNAQGLLTARSILGRSAKVLLRYSF